MHLFYKPAAAREHSISYLLLEEPTYLAHTSQKKIKKK